MATPTDKETIEKLVDYLKKEDRLIVVGGGFAEIETRCAIAAIEAQTEAAVVHLGQAFEESAVVAQDLFNEILTLRRTLKIDRTPPRRDGRRVFRCKGAKKGSEFDLKKGYVKRSKRDVYRKL